MNCVVYDSNSEEFCDECIEGYVISNSGLSCIEIVEDEFPNCESWGNIITTDVSLECIRCEDGYYVNTSQDNQCSKYAKEAIKNCEIPSINENNCS